MSKKIMAFDEKPITFISVKDCSVLQNNDCSMIDVREEKEYLSIRIKDSQLFPLSQLKKNMRKLLRHLSGKKSAYILCKIGHRAMIAAKMIQYHNKNLRIFVIQGGICAWIEEGLPYESA